MCVFGIKESELKSLSTKNVVYGRPDDSARQVTSASHILDLHKILGATVIASHILIKS